MKLIIVTGLSGAGKTQAVNCLEDLGYYCVDNMPPALMTDFIGLAQGGNSELDRIAFVADIRGGRFFEDLMVNIEKIKSEGVDCRIVFLEASDEVLIKRYNESRRSHPLHAGGSLQENIAKERSMLEDLRKKADLVIDTSSMKSANLHNEIREFLADTDNKETAFTVTVESFGYKHGILSEADWVLDTRFLPNPFYVPSLKKLTGNNKKVRDYVLKPYEARDFVARICGLVSDIIPNYIKEGKYHLVIGVGCTGGQHRSVAMANEISDKLKAMGKHVITIHRDLK